MNLHPTYRHSAGWRDYSWFSNVNENVSVIMSVIMSILGNQIFAVIYVEAKQVQPVLSVFSKHTALSC